MTQKHAGWKNKNKKVWSSIEEHTPAHDTATTVVEHVWNADVSKDNICTTDTPIMLFVWLCFHK